MFFLSLETENPSSISIPAATAIGESKIIAPRSVFPSFCHKLTLLTASLITFPIPTFAGLIFSLDTFIPCSAACLKCGATATADAKKCSYRVSSKSAVRWTFPGFGCALTSRRTANSKHLETCSVVSLHEPRFMRINPEIILHRDLVW